MHSHAHVCRGAFLAACRGWRGHSRPKARCLPLPLDNAELPCRWAEATGELPLPPSPSPPVIPPSVPSTAGSSNAGWIAISPLPKMGSGGGKRRQCLKHPFLHAACHTAPAQNQSWVAKTLIPFLGLHQSCRRLQLPCLVCAGDHQHGRGRPGRGRRRGQLDREVFPQLRVGSTKVCGLFSP